MPHNVEEDFLEAFQRLSMGAPSHPKLQARVAAGKTLAVNQSTVSLEAGHSRTLLSQRAPGYERICKLLYPEMGDVSVTSDKGKSSKPETSKAKLIRLKLEVSELTEQRDHFATLLSEAYLALNLKDQEIATLSAEIKRRKANSSLSENFEV